MEELLLGGILAVDELHVIDHQHVHRAEQILKRHGVLEPQRADELVHELFGGKVDHTPAGGALADIPGQGMHEMGLAEPHPAIEKQRIKGHLVGFRHAAGGGEGQLVGLADDEIGKRIIGIERRADVLLPVGPGAVAQGGIASRYTRGSSAFRRPGGKNFGGGAVRGGARG